MLMHDKLYPDKVKELLWRVPFLKPAEQEYVKALLMRYEKHGITHQEAEGIIQELRDNHHDMLHTEQVEAIAKVFEDYFGGS